MLRTIFIFRFVNIITIAYQWLDLHSIRDATMASFAVCSLLSSFSCLLLVFILDYIFSLVFIHEKSLDRAEQTFGDTKWQLILRKWMKMIKLTQQKKKKKEKKNEKCRKKQASINKINGINKRNNNKSFKPERAMQLKQISIFFLFFSLSIV